MKKTNKITEIFVKDLLCGEFQWGLTCLLLLLFFFLHLSFSFCIDKRSKKQENHLNNNNNNWLLCVFLYLWHLYFIEEKQKKKKMFSFIFENWLIFLSYRFFFLFFSKTNGFEEMLLWLMQCNCLNQRHERIV